MLPRGTFSEEHGQGLSDKPGTPPHAQLVFSGGGKAAAMAVTLNKWPVPVPAQLSQCPDTAYHPYSHCTQTALAGGATLVLDRSPVDEKRPAGPVLLTALLTGKDGKQVLVSETTSSKGQEASGKTSLPLSLGQLSHLATSSVWHPVLGAMPAPPALHRTAGIARMTGQQISHVIEQLLPAGMHATQKGGSDGFGHVTVDDGRGKSLVAVNVQRWKRGDSDMAKLFATAGTLPDGTRIKVRRGPASRGGKGAVEWTVDTLRKDGLRVVISTVNAGAYQLPADRREPALNITQLKQIVLNSAWIRAAGS
ncbi:hypothetical protein [Streptomyces sp. AF1A]|uniref:hypothetical protein n=1 Tax=Streptomyces sp. AF1A TaxID=3394350 RepID=UPI0039BCF798